MSGMVITEQPGGHLVTRVPGSDSAHPLPRIYVLVNAWLPGSFLGEAISEDGHWLAQWISSTRAHFRHDMGLSSERNHETYRAHFPGGFELVEVPDGQLGEHPGLNAAIDRFERRAKE